MADKPVGTLFAEVDLDLTKVEQKMVALQKRLVDGASKSEEAFKTLGISSDRMFVSQKATAEAAYTAIKNKATSTAADIVRAQEAMVAKINSINASMLRSSSFENLGIRSVAAIEAQKAAVIASYETIKKSGTASAQDLVNIERAKNEKLKSLNKEMVGEHEMSMASMTRAVLRFYAAYYVASTALLGIKNLFMGGVEAIDSLKVSTVAVAAQITSMQGTSGNILENYKQNVVYAEALNKKLMETDANSFANYQEIQLMNRAMISQGVLLDINNAKQVESFTALTNAVRMFTQGQDKERQASQETRSLMSGQIRVGDQVAMQMDAMIKRQGEYKDGLKELVAEGKKHGDTLERMYPYLIGIVAASGDIQKTWESVGSSFDTAWGILQRNVFKDFYKDLIEGGQSAAKWTKDNAEQIASSVKGAYEAIKVSIEAAIATVGLFAVANVAAAVRAGDAWAFFVLRWEALWAAMTTTVTMSISKWTLAWSGFTSFIAGWSIGKYLSDEFEWVRYAGISMVYGIVNAWEFLIYSMKKGWTVMKGFVPFTDKNKVLSDLKEIETAYIQGKTQRDKFRDDQFKDNSDAAMAAAKKKAVEVLTMPDLGGVLDSNSETAKKAADEYARLAEQASKFRLTASQEVELSGLEGLRKELQKNAFEAANSKTQFEGLKGKERELTFSAIDQVQAMKDRIAVVKETEAQRKLAVDGVKKENEAKIEQINYAKRLSDEVDGLRMGYDRGAISAQRQFTKAINILNAALDESRGKTEGAILSLEEYNQLTEQASLLKDISIREADLDFYAEIEGAENSLYELQKKNVEDMAKLWKLAGKDEVDIEKWKTTQIWKLDQELFEKKTRYIADGFGALSESFRAISDLYAEGSEDAHQWEEAAKAMEIAQRAVAVVNAVVAISAAAAAPFPAGLIAMTQMAASMGALLSSIGESINSGHSSSTVTVLPASTVLGAEAGTGSESITKSWELLQDTYDMEYRELSGIYNEMKSLNDNISGLVSGIVRSGSITGFNISTSTTEGFAEKLSNNIFDSVFNTLGNFALLNPIVTGINKVFGNLLGSALGSVFGGGKTTTLTASGISTPGKISVGDLLAGGSIGARQYAIVKVDKDGGWFGSDSTSYYTYYKALNSNVSSLLDKVFRNMGSTLVTMAGEFGTDVNDALGYIFAKSKINLKGLSGEKINTKLNEYFSGIGDTAVEKLFGSVVSNYQKVGEGLMETASRLIMDKAIILDTLDMTRQAFTGTTPEIIAFSEAIINMAGDLDSFREAVATYFDKFFTDEEKQLRLQEQLSGALADMNMALPSAREGYRALVEALDLSTVSGQEAYVSLLNMAEYADAYYSAVEDAAGSTDNLIESLKSLTQTIDDWLASLTLNSDLAAGGTSLEAWQSQYTKLQSLAMAPGAEAAAVDSFLNYATDYLGFMKSYGGNYSLLYESVVNDVKTIRDIVNGATITTYGSGGLAFAADGKLTSGVTIAGEIGPEWIVPTYEPQRSRFLRNAPDSFWGNIMQDGNREGSNRPVEITLHNYMIIDGKEISRSVQKHIKTDGSLKEAIRRVVQ